MIPGRSLLANISGRSAAPVATWRLLEMERNALLMFTSCGWFFSDLAGLESTQVLRYAARALDLAGDEVNYPGSLFTEHFQHARDAGWQITVHAGEAAGPDNIWQAINELKAARIGHALSAPDDQLLGAVLLKLFADRQLAPTPEALNYLVKHMTRDFATARAVVAVVLMAGLLSRTAAPRPPPARGAGPCAAAAAGPPGSGGASARRRR